MEKVKEAVIAALEDPKVVAAFAEAILKQVSKKKSTPANIEETLVSKHVLFAKEGSETATFMTSKEVAAAVLEFNEDIELKPRVFGRCLLNAATESKKSNLGQVYLIEGIYEDANKPSEVVKEEEEKKEEEEIPEEEKAGSRSELFEMSKDELKAIIKEHGYDIKTKKRSVKEIANDFLTLQTPSSEEEIKEIPVLDSVELGLLMEAVNDCEDMSDYKDLLKGMSKKALIKHINKFKMKVEVKGLDEDEIIEVITNYMDLHLAEDKEVEEAKDDESSSVSTEERTEKKKKSKKDKKKKKKNKS